jgi:hypothetical protein
MLKVSTNISKTSFCPFWCVLSEVSMFLWISAANDLSLQLCVSVIAGFGGYSKISLFERSCRVREAFSSKGSKPHPIMKSPKNSWSEAVVFAVWAVVLSVWYKQSHLLQQRNELGQTTPFPVVYNTCVPKFCYHLAYSLIPHFLFRASLLNALRTNVREWIRVQLVNTLCSHLQSFCTAGDSGSLATKVTLEFHEESKGLHCTGVLGNCMGCVSHGALCTLQHSHIFSRRSKCIKWIFFVILIIIFKQCWWKIIVN